MPALSKKQQKFMGIVRSIQKGEQPASKFSKDAQDVAKDMKKKDVKKFASTKHKGLPMKKEILGKLKELIKQELSEYTYGVGDVVKDVNPTCLHYGAIGKVKEVNPKYVKFVVMNNGDRFKKGQTLEKSHDQMKKMNENKVVKVGDRKYKLTPLNSIRQIEKLAYNGRVSYRGLGVFGANVFELSINTKVWHASSVKQKEQYFISGSDLDKLKKKVDDSPFLAGGLPFSGTLKGWKPIKPDDRVGIVSNLKESVNENKVYKVGDTVSLLSFDRRHRGRAKVKGVTKSRANKFGIKNHYITNKGTFTDMEVEGTEAFKLRFKGDTEKKVTKAMNSPYGVVLPEEINELKKSTVDMMDALLKIKNPMPKEIESALIMMAKGYGLDYVKKEVQRDAKGFYKNLKQMAAAFPEFRNKPKNYKFESVINERNYSVNSGKEYSKNFLGALELVIRQANNLKGALAKHPIKRNINKLKAIQNLYKRFLKPTIDQSNNNYYAVDMTQLKKYLQDGKFKSALQYEIKNAIDSRYMSHNHFGSLDDKQTELRKRIVSVILDLVNKMDKANLESVNESFVSSGKVSDVFLKLKSKGFGNKKFGDISKELSKHYKTPGLADVMASMFKEIWMKGNKREAEKEVLDWLKTVAKKSKLESVNEGKGVDKIMKMADDYSYGKIAGKTVDVMTAKLFQAAYNKAPQKAKDKVDKMNEKQLYIFMMNLWKRFGKQVRLGS